MHNRQAWGGIITISGAVMFILIVFLLQLLQDDYDPVNQLMSELVFTPQGSVMIIAFVGLGVCSAGLQVSIGGNDLFIQLILTGVTLCFTGAGFFTLANALTIHILLVAIAFVLCGLAMYLMPYLRRDISVISPHVSWGFAIAMCVSAILGQTLLPLGIGQRLATIFLLAWFIITGWQFIQIKSANFG